MLNIIVTLKSGLEVTQDHSNWYHLKARMRFPIHPPSIVTTAVSLTVHEIFSVKVQRDLEKWVSGCSRSYIEKKQRRSIDHIRLSIGPPL